MEFGSLIPYAGDFVITITVCLLIVLGGLGFFVWSDIYSARDNGRLHTQTKIVLRVTLLLIALAQWSFLLQNTTTRPPLAMKTCSINFCRLCFNRSLPVRPVTPKWTRLL